MITPVGVTLADYIAAVKADEPTHIRITFSGQNVVLDDSDIDSSGIVVNDYLNGDTDLIMGKAVMKNITIPIIRSAKLNGLIWNGEFTVEIGQEVSGITKWITYGYFTGSRPEKVNSVDVIEFTANDRMALFDRLAAPWISSLTYPKTVKQLFQSLCTFCGTGYENGDELANMASKSYSSFPYQYEGQTCREVLAQIAEACGCYAKIMPNGNCKLVWYANHTSDYTVAEADEFPPVEIYEYSEGKTWAELENYKWADLEHFRWSDLSGTKALFKIEMLNVINTIRGDSVQYPSATSGNTYVVVDNPFIEYDTATKITNYVKPIYDRLAAFGGYLPLKVSCLGNALIESGDVISVVVSGVTHSLPIFCKRFSWNGALVDYYEATGQINRAEVSVDTVRHISENTKYYNRQSGIDILPDGVEINGSKYIKIKSGADIFIEAGGKFQISSGNFKIDEYGNVEIVGSLKAGSTFAGTMSANCITSGSMSADRISGGTLIIGGNNNVNGTLIIKNASNQQIGKWDKDGIEAITGIFRGSIAAADGTFTVDASEKTIKLNDWLYDENGSLYEMYNQFAVFTVGSRREDWSDGHRLYEANIKPNGGSSFDVSFCNKWGRFAYMNISGAPGNASPGHPDTDTSEQIKIMSVRSNIRFGEDNYPIDSILVNRIGKHLPTGSPTYVKEAYITTINYVNLVQTSSRDVKHDIQDISSEGDRLDKLHPVTYVYNNDSQNRKRYGLIYEETIEVMPEITTQDDNNKAINYVELIPILLKETQELRKRVSDLENRVAKLEGRG